MQQTQIIILAAGKGKRMDNQELPKVLLPLGGKPIISHLLKELAKLEEGKRPVTVVGYKSTNVKEALGKNYTYAVQRDQLGTGHAVWCAEKQISAKNVLVLYGDMPFIKAASLRKLMQLHSSAKSTITMFTTRVPNFEKRYASFVNFGRIIRDRFDNIIKITEYKDATDEERAIREVNPGIYMFRSDWLWSHIDQIGSNNIKGEYYLTDIVEVAIREETAIYSLPLSVNEILGINTKEQLREAERLLRLR